jgi:hypothetical protein
VEWSGVAPSEGRRAYKVRSHTTLPFAPPSSLEIMI